MLRLESDISIRFRCVHLLHATSKARKAAVYIYYLQHTLRRLSVCLKNILTNESGFRLREMIFL